MNTVRETFAAWLPGGSQAPATDITARIVFVCEHGAAKSLIAAACFSKLATECETPVRASLRAITLQDDVTR